MELACDAISVRTLTMLGVPPQRLQTAAEKVWWFNRERLGVALDEDNYPSLKERGEIIQRMSSFKSK